VSVVASNVKQTWKENKVKRSNTILSALAVAVFGAILCAAAIGEAAEPQKVRIEIRQVRATGTLAATRDFVSRCRSMPAIGMDAAVAATAAGIDVAIAGPAVSQAAEVAEGGSAILVMDDPGGRTTRQMSITVSSERSVDIVADGVRSVKTGRDTSYASLITLKDGAAGETSRERSDAFLENARPILLRFVNQPLPAQGSGDVLYEASVVLLEARNVVAVPRTEGGGK
jgi:hypothetical protein